MFKILPGFRLFVRASSDVRAGLCHDTARPLNDAELVAELGKVPVCPLRGGIGQLHHSV